MTTPFYVLILGSGSAIPKKNKNHTSQLLVYNNKRFLLDCGEGTQVQLMRYGQSVQKIDGIFISHLHGDHYLGLMGLISTMNLLGRQKKLEIYGPPETRKIVQQHLELANSRCGFHIEFHDTQDGKMELLLQSDQIRVYSFPLKHKIPTTGFLFEAGSIKRKMRPDLLEEYNVPKTLRAGIRDGKDYEMPGGKVIPNEKLTNDPPPFRRYAYCTDTVYLDDLHNFFKKVELVYHEATFTDEDRKHARDKFHSTGIQAASVAKSAKCKKLLIGHFSNKYIDGNQILEEARSVFSKTFEAIEGERYEIE